MSVQLAYAAPRFAAIVLTFVVGCGDDDGKGGAGGAVDAAADAAELHCDSWLTWCEDGVVYRAYPDYADDSTCGAGRETCNAADFGALATVLEQCPGACIDENVCAWCESTDQPGCSDLGAPRAFCLDGLDAGARGLDDATP